VSGVSNLQPGMHDNPNIFPTLPSRETDAQIDDFSAEGGTFRKCWEYVLTHSLTEGEGAAFWTAANLMYETLTTFADETCPHCFVRTPCLEDHEEWHLDQGHL